MKKMINKLKRKFILINMLLITIVLLITFTAVYASTQQRLVRDSMIMLERTLTEEYHPEALPDRMKKPDRDPDFRHTPTFTVVIDGDGKIISAQGALFDLSDEEALDDIVDSALATGKDSGVIADANLRYLKQTSPAGTKIAFVDRSMEINTLTSLIRSSILVGLGSLLAFFLISLFLAGWALRPVQKAWEQQRQFVADASHELKTPLTVILANAGILLSHPEKSIGEQVKWVEYIQTEATRMTGLVDNMLFLARSDDVHPEAELVSVNLSDTVWGSVLSFEPVIFEQGKTLVSDIEPDLYIKGDESQLRQLVGILLDNACKYTDEKGTIRVELTAAADHQIKMMVSNTGAYIPADQLEHVFERFFRVDKSRARQQGGYGLGLSIANSIVEIHHARISVQSTPETGTSFTITFARSSASN